MIPLLWPTELRRHLFCITAGNARTLHLKIANPMASVNFARIAFSQAAPKILVPVSFSCHYAVGVMIPRMET